VLRGVTYHHGDVCILNEQDLAIPRGGTLLVTGANGAGKSTLMYLCAGLVRPDRGEVRLNGENVSGILPSSLMRVGIRRGFVFQQGGLISNLSALANVALALRYHADLLDMSEAVINERAQFCLGAVGVESPDIHALPGLLSFGIYKRVAFARALALEPNYAFFDDPDAGLDRENAQVVQDILVSYHNDPNVTMVIATNHRLLIERLGIPIHVLDEGQLTAVDRHSLQRPSVRNSLV